MNIADAKVIVLTGRKKAGKDTMALQLIDDGFTRLSFSDQLKRICCKVFPDMLPDYPQEVKDQKILFGKTLSPRDVWLKMNVVTEIEPEILVHSLADELYEHMESGKTNFVITDLRRPWEYEFVDHHSWPICKIVDGCPRDTIDEDDMENFIDEIIPDIEFMNMKDVHSKERFKEMMIKVLPYYYDEVFDATE
jgi:hypothetical protein